MRIGLCLLFIASSFLIAVNSLNDNVSKDCFFIKNNNKTKKLFGQVHVVNSGGTYKVKIVDFNSDLKVQVVNFNPNSCGEWQFVNFNGDFDVQFVDSNEDFSIQFVNSNPGFNQ